MAAFFESELETKIQAGLKCVFTHSTFNFCKGCWKVGVYRPPFEGISRFQEYAFLKEFKAVAQDDLKIHVESLSEFHCLPYQ